MNGHNVDFQDETENGFSGLVELINSLGELIVAAAAAASGSSSLCGWRA